MYAAEVYKIARNVLAPWCKQHEFKRTKSGVLGWYRPVEDGFLVFWLQCSTEGWDAYAGSKFVVVFNLVDRPEANSYYGTQWKRLPHLLTQAQLDEVKQLQNRVIAKLTPPSRDHYIFDLDQEIVERYLRKFEPIAEDYTPSSDIWLRYHDRDDVIMWAEYLLAVLPQVLQRFYPQLALHGPGKVVQGEEPLER